MLGGLTLQAPPLNGACQSVPLSFGFVTIRVCAYSHSTPGISEALWGPDAESRKGAYEDRCYPWPLSPLMTQTVF